MSLLKISPLRVERGRVFFQVINCSGMDISATSPEEDAEQSCSIIFSLRASHPHLFFYRGGNEDGKETTVEEESVEVWREYGVPPLESAELRHSSRSSRSRTENRASGSGASLHAHHNERATLVYESIPDFVILPGERRGVVLDIHDLHYARRLKTVPSLMHMDAMRRQQGHPSDGSGGDPPHWSSSAGMGRINRQGTREFHYPSRVSSGISDVPMPSANMKLCFFPTGVSSHSDDDTPAESEATRMSIIRESVSTARSSQRNGTRVWKSSEHPFTGWGQGEGGGSSGGAAGHANRNDDSWKRTSSSPHESTNSVDGRHSAGVASSSNASTVFLYIYYERLGDEGGCVDAARKWLAREKKHYRQWQVRYFTAVAALEKKRQRDHMLEVSKRSNGDSTTFDAQSMPGGTRALPYMRLVPPVLENPIRWRRQSYLDKGKSTGQHAGASSSLYAASALDYYYVFHASSSSPVNGSRGGSSTSGGNPNRSSGGAGSIAATFSAPATFAATRTHAVSKSASDMFSKARVGSGTVVIPLREPKNNSRLRTRNQSPSLSRPESRPSRYQEEQLKLPGKQSQAQSPRALTSPVSATVPLDAPFPTEQPSPAVTELLTLGLLSRQETAVPAPRLPNAVQQINTPSTAHSPLSKPADTLWAGRGLALLYGSENVDAGDTTRYTAARTKTLDPATVLQLALEDSMPSAPLTPSRSDSIVDSLHSSPIEARDNNLSFCRVGQRLAALVRSEASHPITGNTGTVAAATLRENPVTDPEVAQLLNERRNISADPPQMVKATQQSSHQARSVTPHMRWVPDKNCRSISVQASGVVKYIQWVLATCVAHLNKAAPLVTNLLVNQSPAALHAVWEFIVDVVMTKSNVTILQTILVPIILVMSVMVCLRLLFDGGDAGFGRAGTIHDPM